MNYSWCRIECSSPEAPFVCFSHFTICQMPRLFKVNMTNIISRSDFDQNSSSDLSIGLTSIIECHKCVKIPRDQTGHDKKRNASQLRCCSGSISR
jgi:hypothetical protein